VRGLTAQVVLTAPYYPDSVRAEALSGVFARNQQIGVELAKLLAATSNGTLNDVAQKISTIDSLGVAVFSIGSSDASEQRSPSSELRYWRAIDVAIANLILAIGLVLCIAAAIVIIYRKVMPEKINFSSFPGPGNPVGHFFALGLGISAGGLVAHGFVRRRK